MHWKANTSAAQKDLFCPISVLKGIGGIIQYRKQALKKATVLINQKIAACVGQDRPCLDLKRSKLGLPFVQKTDEVKRCYSADSDSVLKLYH